MKQDKDKKDSNKKKGRMAALSDLKNMASKMMGDDLSEMKKVTVASDSKEGLDAGLTKAKRMLGEKGKMSDMDVMRSRKKKDDEDDE